MDNHAKIIYTGETDVLFSQGDLSLTLRSHWFFSKDRNCFGIPVVFRCTETTGDVVFSISLHDANNRLVLGLSLDFCARYNAVIWVDRNFRNSILNITSSVEICGKHYPPDSITIDHGSANLSESGDAEYNKDREQDCFNNLEFIEVWKLRKASLCFDGIALDHILQNKLRPYGFAVDCFEHSSIDAGCRELCYEDVDFIYYVWCGLHIGSRSGITHCSRPEQAGDDHKMNGLRISAVFSRTTSEDSGVLSDELYVFATDKEHPNADLNGFSRLSYGFFMDRVAWDKELTNILVSFEPDDTEEVLEQQFFDIRVDCHGEHIILRIMLDPNWNIRFGAVQNDLQNGQSPDMG